MSGYLWKGQSFSPGPVHAMGFYYFIELNQKTVFLQMELVHQAVRTDFYIIFIFKIFLHWTIMQWNSSSCSQLFLDYSGREKEGRGAFAARAWTYFVLMVALALA